MTDPSRTPGDTPGEQQPPSADAPTVVQPAAVAAEQPAPQPAPQPNPQPTGPAPDQAAAPPAPPVVDRSGGFRGFARHRATQLVAAGIVGALLGGGVVATVEAVSHRSDGNRPAFARQLDGGQFGPGQGQRGFRGPGSGSGFGGQGNGPGT